MSIYVGKTPIYSTNDKILYIESSRSNLLTLETINRDPKINVGSYTIGQNSINNDNFIIDSNNSNLFKFSTKGVYINRESSFTNDVTIDGDLQVNGDISRLGSLTVNSNLDIGDTLNAYIINTSNLNIFNNVLGKIISAGSNTENGELHEMFYIDNNGGNTYIGGSIGIGTEPNINYSISAESNMYIGTTLSSSNTLTTTIRHNENSITGIYITETGDLILNAEDEVILNGYNLGNEININIVNVTVNSTTNKLYTKYAEVINSTDNNNALNIKKLLQSGQYAISELGNPISILSGDISNINGTQDKYTSNIFQLSPTGHISLGGKYPPSNGNKEYLIRGNIDESRTSHFNGFLHFTNSNIDKQSFTITKDAHVSIGNTEPTSIFEINNNFNENEDTFSPANSMIYLNNSTDLQIPFIQSVEYYDDVLSNLVITSNMDYYVYNSNLILTSNYEIYDPITETSNIIYSSNYEIITRNLVSTELAYDFNTDIYDLVIDDIYSYSIESNLLLGSSNDLIDIVVKYNLFELSSNGSIHFNNELIDMYKYNIEASNILSYNLTVNNINTIDTIDNNKLNFNNSSFSNIWDVYTSNLYIVGDVLVDNLDVFGEITVENVNTGILTTSEDNGFKEVRLRSDKILTIASNIAINVSTSHYRTSENSNDSIYIHPNESLSDDVKALYIKGTHNSMVNRVYNINNSVYIENETVPAKITQEYIINENKFYIGVKNKSYTSNEDASMFITSINDEVSYDTINESDSNIAITIYKNNDVKIGNKAFINKDGHLTIGVTEQNTSNVLYSKGTLQVIQSDLTTSFSIKENGIGIGINEPTAVLHVNHKLPYNDGDLNITNMVLIDDHIDYVNHTDNPLFVINRDGNVGIGVTEPLAKLHIYDNLLPLTTNINNLGSEELRWKTLYTSNLQLNDITLIGYEKNNGMEIQEINKLQPITYQYYNISNNTYYDDYSSLNTMINENYEVSKQKNAIFVNKGDIFFNSAAERVINNIKFLSPPVKNNWHGVTWSPELGLFVAVAYSGTGNRVMTSPDGIKWTTRNSAADNNWTSVSWSSELGLFVAVAVSGTNNRVMTSPDGINWTTRTTLNTEWWDICWAPELGLFVAVGNSGSYSNVMTSSDGINWTTRTTPTINTWDGICWSPELGLLVAVAFNGTNNRIMTSPDGINWTSRYSNSTIAYVGITWSPELRLFAACGSGSYISTSSDGINWTDRILPTSQNWWAITWCSEINLFVCVTTNSKVITSSDGIYWTLRKELSTESNLRNIVWSPELYRFVAVSYGGSYQMMISGDPNPKPVNSFGLDLYTGAGGLNVTAPVVNKDLTWTTRVSPVDNQWRKVCWAAELGLFVAVSTSGTGNRVMTSPDGINWTTRTSAADNNWTSITWAPELGLFVAVSTTGTGDRVMTSPDGINWTTRSSAADNYWWGICWAPEINLLVAVGQSGIGNRVMTSPDGINWTTRSSPVDNNWLSVCWAPELNLLVAVSTTGTGDRVMTSPDGINWTTRSSAVDNGWMDICWSPELRLLVAVSWSGTNNKIMTSPDGINWEYRYSPTDNNWVGVIWVKELGLFVGVSDYGPLEYDRVMTSSDGINWETSYTLNNGWWGLCWSPELSLLVAVSWISGSGTGNRIMTSSGSNTIKTILSMKNDKIKINGALGIGTEPIINAGVIVKQPIGQIPFAYASGNSLLHSPGIEILTDDRKKGIFINNNNDLTFVDSSLIDNYTGVSGYITTTNTDNKLNFTGQHRCYIDNKSYNDIQNMKGLIVSANKNQYRNMSGGFTTGNKAITINESLPVLSLTSEENDIKVFGVISDIEEQTKRNDNYGNFATPYDKEIGDTRAYINSIGEGGIWIINKNGILESGDYITSSSVPGYGMKQDDDIMYSYTVAKITMDCDFNPSLQPIKKIKKDIYGSNILNEYGNIIWEETDNLESEYNIKYISNNGIEITEEEYYYKYNSNELVYKAAFVGCTYHCG